MILYTIGHSNHSIDKFIQLLKAQKVALLIDIRSTPYSRFNPQFNQASLHRSLSEHAIEYAYLGDSLGGRPKDPAVYIHYAIPKDSKDYLHEVNYPEVMQREWFILGVQQLLKLAAGQLTAILCSEEDPSRCHRHHLIARYLLRTHPEVNVLHIRRDSSVLDAKVITCSPKDPGADQLSFLKS